MPHSPRPTESPVSGGASPRADNHAAFGLALRRVRRHRGFTQEQLARVVGTNRTHLSRIERGRVNLTLDGMLSILEALNVRPAEFFALYERIRADRVPGLPRDAAPLPAGLADRREVP